MASEIRVNKIQNRSGLTTTTFTNSGVDVVGIATAFNFKTGTSDVHSSGYNVGTGLTVRENYIGLTGDVSVTGVITASSFSGSLAASNLTGALPAISGANLTGVSGPEVYGFTGIGSNLQVRTTGGGADNITGDQYAAFEQVFFASSGITFSINTSGNLIATI